MPDSISLAIKLHAQHIWNETSIVLPGQPYARQNDETKPLAIVFSQDDVHPDFGSQYLRAASTVSEAHRLAADRLMRVDGIYRQVKAALINGNEVHAYRLVEATLYKCICLCGSEADVVDYLFYINGIGGSGGGLSGSDFFAYPNHFAVTWTPDWSSILELFPE